MTPSQQTRVINWVAMLIAFSLLALVFYHIYQRHFAQQGFGQSYSFDDLPSLHEAPVSADIGQIIDKHIFGVVPVSSEKPVASKPKPKPVPKTPLNINLTGIIDGATPETGMAMLEIERGRTIVVGVGEKIGKIDATLHQVLPGEVLIDRGGAIESVKMVRKALSLASLDDQLFNSLQESGDPDQALDTLPQPSASSSTSTPLYSSGAVQTSRAYDDYLEEEEIEQALRRQSERRAQRRDSRSMPTNKLPIPGALKNL